MDGVVDGRCPYVGLLYDGGGRGGGGGGREGWRRVGAEGEGGQISINRKCMANFGYEPSEKIFSNFVSYFVCVYNSRN